MTDYSSPSARACLLKLERSRALSVWWLGLHLLLALTFIMVNTLAGSIGILLLVVHFCRRHPVRSLLLVISPGGRFALPAAGRFDLTLCPSTRLGRRWAELVFSDFPRERVLVLWDQLDAADWRRLRLACARSG